MNMPCCIALGAAKVNATRWTTRVELEAALQQAANLLASNLAQPMKVSELAREVGFSTPHLIEHFSHRFGCTPVTYRHQKRMHRAASLLEATPLPIYCVAERIGYQSVSSFCRDFKAFHGQTPKTLRNSAILNT